jgi:hypothetical protein
VYAVSLSRYMLGVLFARTIDSLLVGKGLSLLGFVPIDDQAVSEGQRRS